jgi:hypothetical protein
MTASAVFPQRLEGLLKNAPRSKPMNELQYCAENSVALGCGTTSIEAPVPQNRSLPAFHVHQLPTQP